MSERILSNEWLPGEGYSKLVKSLVASKAETTLSNPMHGFEFKQLMFITIAVFNSIRIAGQRTTVCWYGPLKTSRVQVVYCLCDIY